MDGFARRIVRLSSQRSGNKEGPRDVPSAIPTGLSPRALWELACARQLCQPELCDSIPQSKKPPSVQLGGLFCGG